MATLVLNCLGAFRVNLNGKPLAFDTDKTRALLAYLALEKSRPQQREHLGGMFWSDMPDKRALHNLRQALSSLRKVLQDEQNDPPILLVDRNSAQINPDADIWVDVVEFESGLTTALQHYKLTHGNQPQPNRLNLSLLLRAVNLFQGPFLNQLFLHGSPLFDEWTSLKREALNQRMIEALSILTNIFERRGETGKARHYANQVVALAPWDETAHVQVMRLFAIEGQWSAAQAQYFHLRRYLKEQIGVEPAVETIQMFEDICHHASHQTPFPSAYPVARHNLPGNTGIFVGRESELDSISSAFASPNCRLLTLVGPGGIGKSRLALEAAWQQVGIFRDGVYFVPLAGLSSEHYLAETIADTLNLTTISDETTTEQLVQYVKGKEMLWFLDNLEQLLPLSNQSLIPQILKHAPRVAILATSRQRLHLQQECLLPLEGLPYPPPGATQYIADYPAVQLFVRCAQHIRPSFCLNQGANLQSVIRICQLLEGLPLGVELAAASIWLHTPKEIGAELQDNLNNLTSTAVDASDRHRNLSATFETSWALLTQTEQELLASLSVFRGGFSSELAQKAMAAHPDLLASLVDKSFLRRDAAGRYDMHAAIRQFSAEKLFQEPEQAVIAHQVHALSFSDFLKQRVKPLKSEGQLQALADIAREWENVRRAWHWFVAEKHIPSIAASTEAIYHFCNIRSRYQEGLELFAQALPCLQAAPHTLARVLTFQGALANRILDTDLSDAALNQALAIYKNLDAPNDQALCLVFTSRLAFRKRQHPKANQLGEQALLLFEQTGDIWGQAYAWYQLGLLESRAGRVSEAQMALQTSLQTSRRVGDQYSQIGPLNKLADLTCQIGAYTKAREYFEANLNLSRALGDRFNTSIALGNLGTVYHFLECYDEAQDFYEKSLTVALEIGDQTGQALALSNLGELGLVRRRFSEGITRFQEGLALAIQAGDEWAALVCQINLADAALGQEDQLAAIQYLKESLPVAVELFEPALILRTLLLVGRLYLMQGHSDRAVDLWGLVLHHEAAYDEYRQAAQQAIAEAGAPLPQSASLNIDAAVEQALTSLSPPPACVTE